MAEIKLFDVNLEDYRNKLQQLRAELALLTQDTAEYDEKQQELVNTTNELSNAVASSNPSMTELKTTLKGLKTEWANANSEAERGAIALQIGVIEVLMKTMNQELKNSSQSAAAAEGSYNSLVVKMRELQLAAKATNDEAERINLSQKANEINQLLKSMDAEMGNYQRNVGDYANQFAGAMTQMGVSLGGVEKGFALASTGAKGFKLALDTLSAHPLIVAAVVVIGAVVMIFQLLKEAIGENEELTNRLSVAFSAFLPIMDGVTKAIAYLASGLVTAIEWFSKLFTQLTDGSTTAGKIFLGVIQTWSKALNIYYTIFVNVTRNILKSFMALPKGINDGLNWIFKKFDNVFNAIDKVVIGALDILGKGIGNFMRNFATVLSAIGLDDWASGVTNAANKVAAGVQSAYSSLKGFAKGMLETSTSALDSIWKGIDTGADFLIGLSGKFNKLVNDFTNNYSKNAKEAIKLKESEIDVEKRLRQEQVLTAQSEAKQAKLRDDIAKETNPKKKIELEKELRTEIETTGKRQVALAKEQLALAQKRASLTPNSKEDNENLARLEANVSRTESAYTSSMARVDKQITKQIASSAKAAEARSNKEIAEAEKANREKEKKAREYVTNVNKILSDIGNNATTKVNEVKSNEELYASAGLLSPEMLRNYANERYDIIKDSIQKQIEELDKALKSDEITEEQRASFAMRQNALIIQSTIEKNKHQSELNKIWLDENKKIYEKDAKNYEQAYAKDSSESARKNSGDITNISQQYADGKISYEEYEEQLKELQEQYNADETDREIQHLQEMLDLKKQYLADVLAQFGENSEEYLRVKEEYDAQELALEDKKTARILANAERQANDRQKADEKQAKKVKTIQQTADAVTNLASNIGSAWKNIVQAQLDAGEITEEEAEAQFEKMKALEVATATVSTLAGAVGAFMGTWQDKTIQPVWLRGVLAGTNAASVLAAGIAQIAQIKSTSLNSSGISGNSITVANATPLLDEAQDVNLLTSLNVNGDSGTNLRVYILQSDIVETTNQNKVRVEQSTF